MVVWIAKKTQKEKLNWKGKKGKEILKTKKK